MERSGTLRDQLTAGLVAGLAGAVVMDAFLYAAWLRGIPAEPVLGMPAWSAAGLVLHVLVAIAWACGYAYLSRSQPQIVRLPVVSGAAFGIVVYTFMQLLVIIDGGYHRPSGGTTIASLLGYIVFYGVPVATIVARMLRRA